MVLSRHTARGWIVPLVAFLAVIGVVGWQRHEWQSRRHRLAVQSAEIARLTSVKASHDEPPEVAERRAALESALNAADAELAQLRRAQPAAVAAAQVDRMKPAPSPNNVEEPRFSEGAVIESAEWRNAGRATPAAALETVLWAAAGGDVDTFAASLWFADSNARQQAQRLFDELPSDAKQRYRRPEGLIAALTIPEVPIGTAERIHWGESTSPNFAYASLRLASEKGTGKNVVLLFLSQADGWRVVATPPVIARVATWLKGEGAVTAK